MDHYIAISMSSWRKHSCLPRPDSSGRLAHLEPWVHIT
jgi:hypothetical protein